MVREGDGGDQKIEVFLSWSGEPSRLLATALESHLKNLSRQVVPGDRLSPWLSEDLEPGAEWASTLIPRVRSARVAILCLTRRNVTAPWISFETGVFYSSRLKKAVIPFLLDVTSDGLSFPLGLFQGLQADRNGSKALFVRIGELAGIGADAVEPWFLERWGQIEEEFDDIRKDGSRREEPGNWLNVANAFYLGHDLRWTIDIVEDGSPADIVHGLKQILHQADELGLSGHNDFAVLTKQVELVHQLPDAKWTDRERHELEECLKTALERFGELVRRRQPSYRAYSDDNKDSWLAMQARRRA
jgi:hypothetical protein